MSQQPFVIERVYNAPVNKVWKAITDRQEMKQWYFDLAEFKATPGFEFEFKGGPDDGVQYLHKCKITEAIAEKKLAYTWSYDGYAGESLVTFELFDEAGKTRLRLTHSGLDAFPANNPDFASSNFEAGWNHIIGISLKEYVEKVQ